MKDYNDHEQTLSDWNDMSTLTEDARALLAATADVAGEKVGAARNRLAATLEGARKICNRVRKQTADGVKAADQTVRAHPYQAIGIALGAGALIGFLLTRRD